MGEQLLERRYDDFADALPSEAVFMAEAPLGTAIPIAEIPQYEATRYRFRQFMGAVALAKTVEMPPQPSGRNLLESINRTVYERSEEDEALIDINVGTAASEACFKKDHVTRITMHRNEAGELVQFGQTMKQFQYNSLVLRQKRHTRLEAVTRQEALHGHLIEDLVNDNTLDDYWLVVSSLVPQDVPEADLGEKGDGYFLHSLTYVNQATTQQNGEVVTESAFSAGTDTPENATFEEHIARRHDVETISRVRQRLGLAPITSTDEALEGILVHKSVMPNGVVDFMRMCDEEADKLLNRSVLRDEAFYTNLLAESIAKEESLADTKKAIKADLLAVAGTLQDPMEAIQLLWDLTKKHSVRSATTNLYIDARAFGAEAVAQVEESRYRYSIGDFIGAEMAIREALKVATISGCGGGSSKEKDADGNDVESEGATNSVASEREDSPEAWKWKTGVCRVEVCPTRPGKTKIGPCDVCRRCQAIFDRGSDPTKFKPIRKRIEQQDDFVLAA